ncbi:DUF3137 domain-containing protein [Campylobacter sp.]|uniref:DUF3137 domain-containing protein n=1 Tax=Campylobacter sp. TaxID=205 RepID=UPI00270A65B6|nr:DUF3137 domain-containing protein [Campylobacter sp.]
MKILLELEKERKLILSKFFSYRTAATLAIFVCIFYALNQIFTQIPPSMHIGFLQGKNLGQIFALLISLFLTYVVYDNLFFYFAKQEKHEFAKKYKKFYLESYLGSLGFSYDMHSYVNLFYIMQSRLFFIITSQHGNDLVSGEIEGVKFSFSDLRLVGKDSFVNPITGESDDRALMFFKGLFFMASFNKKIESKTFVLSRGKPGEPMAKEIIVDNVEFNELFKVYTTDIQNAMYILSPSLMQAIVKLAKYMRVPIGLSFVEERIYIRIDRGIDSFEPDIHQSIVSKNLDKRIIADLNSLFNIIRILKLNHIYN